MELMAISMKRLRVGLVLGAALLMLTIAGFLGYARYRTHRFLAGLPGRLGIDIRRETNGYTFSKSVGPNTTMTLHASKAVEHKDGKLTLHDVSMVLYGRKQDRADRISGAEFEYDQQTGVVRAMGEVHIDLQAPARGQPGMPTQILPEDKGVIHVKTSGLVFLQKLGIAATDQELEFQFGAMTGRAHGAEYNSDTGMVILQSAVEAHGEEHGAPVTIHAAHAELDRPKLLVTATDVLYSSPTQRASGNQVVVHLRNDSSPERIEADGRVQLASAAGGSVTAPHAEALLTAKGQAESAHLFGGGGGVNYQEKGALREVHSQSEDARIAFDAKGKAHTVLLTGKVLVVERARPTLNAAWSGRDAIAGRMNFALDDGVLREVEANEAARVTLRDAAGVSELAGETLRGHFVGGGKTAQLTDLHATGHTSLYRQLADGAEQTSAGDTLDITMRPGTPAKDDPAQAISRATQSGHVVLTSKASPKAGTKATADNSRATAELAVYDGASDHVTLTGAVEIVDKTGRVSADSIVLERASGDAEAVGAVKATYLQAGAANGQPPVPVHVIADGAELLHDAQRAIFRGIGRPARIWRAGSQVEAPMLELDRSARTLTAHGERIVAGTPVHSVLEEEKPGTSGKPLSPVRVASRTMVYRDEERRVEFAGEVLVEDADGTARASEATAYLQSAQPSAQQPNGTAKVTPATAPGLSLGGGVERIVARGQVRLEQPGRRATGEELVYTAKDQLFVLTGTLYARPRLMDETQGTVTGQTLSFHSGDKAVTVTGGVGERVQTVTRVKQR